MFEQEKLSESSQSDDEEVLRFVNPLTIDAVMFLNTLNKLPVSAKVMDSKLCELLEKIVLKIEDFLNLENLKIIVPSKQVTIINPKEVECLERHYVCTKCVWDLGVSCEPAALHLIQNHPQCQQTNNRKKQSGEKKQKANVSYVEKLIKSDIDNYIDKYINVADDLKNAKHYENLECDLQDLMQSIFPNKEIKIYKFGSRFFGLATHNSDVDIYVDIGNNFNNIEDSPETRSLHYINIVSDRLKREKHLNWSIKYVLEKALVPIIRLHHRKLNYLCDIGFRNSMGYCNTRLIEYFFNLQPIIRRVCVILKRIPLGSSITNYTIVLMVIFMFQVENKIPAVETLQKDIKYNLQIGPWIGDFQEMSLYELDIENIDINSSQTQLYIHKFLKFYAAFPYNEMIICPYLGRPIKRSDLENLMPKRYLDYVCTEEKSTKDYLKLDKRIIVQDPLQLNHNVAKAFSSKALSKFQSMCKFQSSLIK